MPFMCLMPSCHSTSNLSTAARFLLRGLQVSGAARYHAISQAYFVQVSCLYLGSAVLKAAGYGPQLHVCEVFDLHHWLTSPLCFVQ